MRNNQYNTLDVKNICENKLEINFRGSKECNGWFLLNGKRAKRITVSKGRKPIPMGTYKSMARQLGLTVSQFDDLLLCPLDKAGYEEILNR